MGYGHAGVADLNGQVGQFGLKHGLLAPVTPAAAAGQLFQRALGRPAAAATGRVADTPAVRVADSGLHIFFDPLLLLLVGLLLHGAEQGEDDAGLRVDADGRDEDLAAALHDVRAGEHHRVAVGALLDVVGLAG